MFVKNPWAILGYEAYDTEVAPLCICCSNSVAASTLVSARMSVFLDTLISAEATTLLAGQTRERSRSSLGCARVE